MYPKNLPGGADTLIGMVGAISLTVMMILFFIAIVWFLQGTR